MKKITANDIVGVQPMTQPNGIVYHLRYRYGKKKPTFAQVWQEYLLKKKSEKDLKDLLESFKDGDSNVGTFLPHMFPLIKKAF